MKIRTGFVSNSSSSSFLCDVCGRLESGFDESAHDFNMEYCEHGHLFCTKHKKEIQPSTEYMRNVLREECIGSEEDQKNITEYSDDEVKEYFDEIIEDYDEVPAIMCPICTLLVIMDSDIITYMCHKFNVTKTDIEKEIRTAFSTLKEFSTQCEKKK